MLIKYKKLTKQFILLLLLILNIYLYKDLIINFTLYKRIIALRPANTLCIIVIFGTRPEAVKLIPIIKELKMNNKFFCVTINTGQHKSMTKQILESLNMSKYVDLELNIMRNNQSLTKLTSRIILELDKIYSFFHPDSVIVQGDTTTSFAAALSAFYKKIPIFHVESGLRTKNIYSPFPEEFNRISIDDISTLLFAPTNITAINLLKEDKNPNKIFITGNTIVDTLKLTLNRTYPSKNIYDLIETAKAFYKNNTECKIILLTCHRRENYFSPISNILKAVEKLLKKFHDIVIIIPFHLNPNIIQSIKMGLSENIFNHLINRKEIKDPLYSYLNRLFIIKPLNYIDLIHLLSISFFIMTDSGGIQEESISIGKPVLILRENTERIEGVKLGSALLTGTSIEKIYYYASLLLNNETIYNKMSKQNNNVYGYGNSSKIIVNIIERYFGFGLPLPNFINFNYSDGFNLSKIFYKFDGMLRKSNNEDLYELVIVLTVWKRNNIESQLMQIKRQSIIERFKINIIIFQNSNHIDITDIIKKWNISKFNNNIKITYINSPFETGYFGRFLSPLMSFVTTYAYFIICDDDIIWGDRYFENMIRLVDEGYLATRNGRLIDKNFIEIAPNSNLAWKKNIQVCYDDDIEYDFGGHIWAGRISWLRNAWTHIPVSIENCEDFWLSAVLKTFYNISTRTPKCPCPENNIINPDFCAASHLSANLHLNSKVGDSLGKDYSIRSILIKLTCEKYNYKPLLNIEPKIYQEIQQKFKYGNETYPIFNLTDHLWDNVLFWQ